MRIGVLGIGNVLMGDDALGAHVLARLQAGWEFPPEVALLEAGTPGAGLSALLREHDAVVVVDALRLRAPPGELRVLDRAELLGARPVLPVSPHEPGLREALLTLDFEGRAPPVVKLVGVVPARVELGIGLSGEVRAAVPAAVEEVLRQLAALGAPARPRPAPGAPDLWWEAPPGAAPPAGPPTAGLRIRIRGTVQGVGMRPFVWRLATGMGIAGRVRNDARGVTVEAFGEAGALRRFVDRLAGERPPAARFDELAQEPLQGPAPAGFTIAESERPAAGAPRSPSIPADRATCDACLAELRDPSDRRHRYPFTNCTDCGPRYTIARDVPYDRAATTMAPFAMCERCAAEYRDPSDRRFHAEPNACPACGPRVWLVAGGAAAPGSPPAPGRPPPAGPALAVADDAIREAGRALAGGRIVAVKGIGGFHLACDAGSSAAVAELRRRKRREEKPLAVMVAGLAEAGRLAALEPAERELLASPERPIVLAARRPGAPLAPELAPGSPLVGLLLPYSPLHHLLLEAAGRPLVMTSGNLSEEPIAAGNGEALARLGAVADLFLLHDREIESRADDSVARVVGGRPLLLRRSRGFVPRPHPALRPFARPVLACGALLKNAFCLAAGDRAWLGPHLGDLENLETMEAFEGAVARFERFLRLRPEVVAHDLHPQFLSTRYALRRAGAEGLRAVAVQHHHAHVAAAMGEHGLAGEVLGLAWDGFGLGPDGAAWGGELLRARLGGFERVATLRPLRLPGGDRAVRQPWRTALAMLADAFGPELSGAPPERLPLFAAVPAADRAVVARMLAEDVNAPPAHGAGRWFDAVGALVLARPRAAFEGQVAMALEAAAGAGPAEPYPFALDRSADPPQLDLRPAVRALVAELLGGASPARLAARFHETLADGAAALVEEAAARAGRLPVVLTGGVFQNRRLAEGVRARLAGRSEVYSHSSVPPGDGGIALGQALVADAVARGG